MSFFEYIRHLQKYLHSIRHLVDDNTDLLVVDVKFPSSWDIQKFLTPEEIPNVKRQKYDSTSINVYTFYAKMQETDVNDMYDRIIYVIDRNVEEEKKQRLLQEKIQELKERFDSLSLEELSQITFKTKEEESDGPTEKEFATTTESGTAGK
jgi:hypothetical protein